MKSSIVLLGLCFGVAWTACPNGFTDVQGKCLVLPPKVVGTPQLNGPVLSADNTLFNFRCKFRTKNSKPGTSYKVRWYFDGQQVSWDTVQHPGSVATLPHTFWDGNMNKNLSCGVSVYEFSPVTHTIEESPIVPSGSYWGGIKVTADDTTINEGMERTLTLTSTLPIICEKTNDCQVDLQLSVNNDQDLSPAILAINKCGVSLMSSDWNETTKTASVTTNVFAKMDEVLKRDSFHKIGYKVIGNNANPMFNGVTAKQIELRVRDEQYHICHEQGDPHIRGFYRPSTYHMYQPGDYVMYDSPKDAKQKITVQKRHWTPSGTHASVCGTAVQNGHEVVTLDICNNPPGDSAPVIMTNKHVHSGILIKRCGIGLFRILIGHFLRITVRIGRRGISVKAVLFPSFPPGHGDCHYRSGPKIIQGDALRKYLLTDVESLLGSAMNTAHGPFYLPRKFCQCGTKNTCSEENYVDDFEEPDLMHSNGRCTVISGRMIHPDAGNHNPAVDPFAFQPQSNSWPTPSGITEKMATDHCRSVIMNYTSSYCLNRNHEALENLVHDCAEDVKSADGYEYLDGAVQAFQWECQLKALKYEFNYKKGTGGAAPAPPPEATSHFCLDFCNFHGQCVEGKCLCDPGFTGEECSHEMAKKPVLVRFKGGSICKRSKGHCDDLMMSVDNIMESDLLKARLTSITMINGVPTESTSSKEVKVLLEHKHLLSYDLTSEREQFKDKTVYGFKVEITVDGKTYSDPLNYYVYDDTCVHCSDSMQCLQKITGCRIDGQCYRNGERHPQDPTKRCVTVHSNSQWSSS